MEPRTFILRAVKPHDDLMRSRQIGTIVEVLESLAFEKWWKVFVSEAKRSRSLQANAYYWGVVVPMMSDATGYEPNEIHEYLCGVHFGWRDKRVPKTPRNPRGLESVPVRTTTVNEDGVRSVLSTMKFMEFTEFAKRFAAEKLNLVIPDPNEDSLSKTA